MVNLDLFKEGIINKTRHTTIATVVHIADNPWLRMKGLLGRKKLLPGEVLIISPCQSIHMFFMQFPIDAIFCDKSHKVVGFCKKIKPFSLSKIFFKAAYVIEASIDTIESSHTQIGDYLFGPS